MHLAEAFLAILAVREDLAVEAALKALCAAMQQHFIDPQHGVMMEKPLGAVDNWFEPGHQFEWFFLLDASPTLRGSALHASLDRAFAFTEQRGGAADRAAAAMLELAEGEQPRDATQRIWAQGRIPAGPDLAPRQPGGAVAPVARLAATLPAACRRLARMPDASGTVSRQDMPSTTPYHLATCYRGLVEYLG